MEHPLKGRKQTKEHIEKRRTSILEKFRKYPRKLLDMKTKLFQKINKSENGCWNWTGAVFKKPYGNYGQMRVGRKGQDKIRRAHVLSYEVFVGKIPDGLELDHLCHNTLCVNPEHLEPVTHKENMKRRKDSNLPYCRHGHLYTLETTYIRPDNGRRECKLCKHPK
jgi:hypothetical protein